MKRKSSLLEKTWSALTFIIGVLAVLFSVANFFGWPKALGWQIDVPTTTLFLLGLLAAEIVVERLIKLEMIQNIIEERSGNLEKNLDDSTEHVISSLQGVSAKVFRDRDEFWAAVKDSVSKAKKSIDVTRLGSDQSAKSDYYELLENAVRQRHVKLRRVIVFQDRRMIEQARAELSSMQSFEYKLGVYDVGWREIPPVMNLIIVDDKEIYAGGGYMSPDQKSTSFRANHPALTQSFSHFFETLWQQSHKLDNVAGFDQFVAESIPELSILRSYEEIYENSSKIALATDSRLWVTGLTPDRGALADRFSIDVGTRLKMKKEIEYKVVTCIRKSSDIESSLSDWKQFFTGTNYIVRALVGVPFFIDVLIRDEEELLIGITAKEAFDGYTKCLRIRNQEVVRAVADWYNIHLWSSATEIIGKNGPNELGIAKIKDQLAMLGDDA